MPEKAEFNLAIPEGFPVMEIPDDNQLTAARIALGKKLFFDSSLSGDKKISCSSCHNPSLAFADTFAVSRGVHNKSAFRNAPSLVNVGFQNALFADAAVPNLELQVFTPLFDSLEMGQQLDSVVLYLKQSEEYNNLAREAYNKDFDIMVLSYALASYQRTLISANSRYDEFVSTGDSSIFTPDEKEGLAVFRSHCSGCHSGPLFTNQTLQNIGTGSSADNGRSRITFREKDRGYFKTPSLRNVGITFPYLHNGEAKTVFNAVAAHTLFLDDDTVRVAEKLTVEQIQKLSAFLETLTDKEYLDS